MSILRVLEKGTGLIVRALLLRDDKGLDAARDACATITAEAERGTTQSRVQA
jgi:hypothetical protein